MFGVLALEMNLFSWKLQKSSKKKLEFCNIGPKIKFYLFGIAARPTEKLAAQIILFAFQTIFFY
jgi:hypothetical protein